MSKRNRKGGKIAANDMETNTSEEKKTNMAGHEQVADKEVEAASQEEKESVEYELEEAQKQIQEEKNKYVYLMAEFDNYRRRVSQEKLDLIDTASKGVISDLLPVVDSFEMALKDLENSEATDAAKKGTELIYKQLLDILKKKGVTEIEALGKTLDTDEHEAISQVPATDDSMKGKVVEVFRKGYKLNGKVIRFAQVVVGM